jgi:hypothetical protein
MIPAKIMHKKHAVLVLYGDYDSFDRQEARSSCVLYTPGSEETVLLILISKR